MNCQNPAGPPSRHPSRPLEVGTVLTICLFRHFSQPSDFGRMPLDFPRATRSPFGSRGKGSGLLRQGMPGRRSAGPDAHTLGPCARALYGVRGVSPFICCA